MGIIIGGQPVSVYTPIIAAGYIGSWTVPATGTGWTKITGFTEVIDTASAWANDAFTVPATGGGKYLISLSGYCTPSSGSDQIAPSIDGTEQTDYMAKSGTADYARMECVLSLTAGQVLTFESVATAAATDTATNGTFFIIKLSD